MSDMAADSPALDADAQDPFTRAWKYWPGELLRRVKNLDPTAQWLPPRSDGSERFWYVHELPEGTCYRLVSADSGDVKPAFDHAAIASVVSELGDESVVAHDLALDNLAFDDQDLLVAFEHAGKRFLRDGGSPAWYARSIAGPSTPAVPSPDGSYQLSVAEHNLVLTDNDGDVRRLTDDGEEKNGYGEGHDHDRVKVLRTRTGFTYPPLGCYWSPNSRLLFASRTDYRDVENYTIAESAPPGGQRRPQFHDIPIAFAGDSSTPVTSFSIIDIERGTNVPVRLPDGDQDLRLIVIETEELVWDDDSLGIYTLAASRDHHRLCLLHIDATSGEAKIIIDERSSQFQIFGPVQYNRPNVRVLPSLGRAIWFSQRSGTAQLYLYELKTGRELGCLTEGVSNVLDIIELDVDERTVFFTATSADSTADPYERYLYAVHLATAEDGGVPVCLTPELGDHQFPGQPPALMAQLLGATAKGGFSPSKKYFLDLHSTLEQPPVWWLRRTDGSDALQILKTDASALFELGWTPPERFSVKLDDVDEPIYGVLYKPSDLNPEQMYPVVERIYAGPQIVAQPRNFQEGVANTFTYGLKALAELGFVTLIMDGPGTPGRSRAFHTLTHDSDDRFGVGFHRRAIEALANQKSYLDIRYVGIYGHSFGGYAAAAAALLEPDFYRAIASSAGIYNFNRTFVDAAERFFGIAEFDGGASVASSAEQLAYNYARWDLNPRASALQGALMLIAAELDENVVNTDQMSFISSLVAAGKDFSSLVVPGVAHNVIALPYVQRRLWRFFLEHLAGTRLPPTLGEPPVAITPMSII